MTTSSSQSPKFTDGWIPYLALAFVGTFIVTEILIVNFEKGLKKDILNIVGLFFLILLAYFFSKTDKKLVKEYILPLVFVAVLFTSSYVLLFKIFPF